MTGKKAENELAFWSSHGPVHGGDGDCVSLTFGMSLVTPPHTPVKKAMCKSLTTFCDHDIGVIVDEVHREDDEIRESDL